MTSIVGWMGTPVQTPDNANMDKTEFQNMMCATRNVDQWRRVLEVRLNYTRAQSLTVSTRAEAVKLLFQAYPFR